MLSLPSGPAEQNLLLWPSRNPIRKTLDAVLAEQLVHAVSRQRVLELYLNEAQFGPNIYGICDAAWYYFNDPPDYMSLKDAYELMEENHSEPDGSPACASAGFAARDSLRWAAPHQNMRSGANGDHWRTVAYGHS